MKVFTTEEETLSCEELRERVQVNPFEQMLVWMPGLEVWTPWYELGWVAVVLDRAAPVHVHVADDDAIEESRAIEVSEVGSLRESAAPAIIQIWDPVSEAWKLLEDIAWIAALFIDVAVYHAVDGEEVALPRIEALWRLQEEHGAFTHVAKPIDGSEELEWSLISDNAEHWPHPPDGADVALSEGVQALEPSEFCDLRPGVAVIVGSAPNGPSAETWLVRGPIFSAGRDDTRSTVLLAIEPFDHPVENASNREQSMRISSKHLAVRIGDGGVTVTDLNSSNGTCVNDSRLEPLTPASLSTGDIVEVGQVLRLRCDIRSDSHGVVRCALLQRIGNREERRYALGEGGVGGSSGDLSSLEPLVSGQAGVGWRVAWTSKGLRLDVAPDSEGRVTLITAGSRQGSRGEGPWWLSPGDAVMVDGEIAAAIQHVSA